MTPRPAIALGLAPLLFTALVGMAPPDPPEPVPLERLVFVTTGSAGGADGCRSISVADIGSGEAVFRGTDYGASRLVSNAAFDTIVTIAGGMFLRRTSPDGRGWELTILPRSTPSVERPSAETWPGGFALMPDDETFLVGADWCCDRNGNYTYYVTKRRLSAILSGDLGPEDGRFITPSLPAVIVPDLDGRRAHVLTRHALLFTIDVATMTQTASPVQLQPICLHDFCGMQYEPYQCLYWAYAILSLDGRYLLANRWDAPELNVVDLVTREAFTLYTGNDNNGGLAINRGWINTGLLALHTGRAIKVYRFEPPLELHQLAELRPAELQLDEWWLDLRQPYGPKPSVAWSADGSQLIAATSREMAEFVVIDVLDGGQRLVPRHYITVCPIRVVRPNGTAVYWNRPADILTANGRLEPPAPTPTATPTASATASPTIAPTASATSTPTRQPSPLWLPLALREASCDGQGHVDVVLVMDASLSMLDATTAGRTKMDAARDAALRFLDLLALPEDQAAIVAFNESASLLQPLTGDRAVLAAAMGRIQNAEFTRIDLGLREARHELSSERHRLTNLPVIILLTDGQANPGGPEPALAEAQLAKGAGIRIFTIGLGEDADRGLLRAIASQPSHSYYAPQADDLEQLYAQIAASLPCPAESYWGRRP